MRRSAVLAIAVLAALAGCGAPFGGAPDGTATTAPGTGETNGTTVTDDASPTPAGIAVRNGSLPVDPTGVFTRLRTITGTDAEPPVAVVVADDPRDGFGAAAPSRFWTFVGVGAERPVSAVPVAENGYTTALGDVVLFPGDDPTAANVSLLLAHEFVHYLQFRTDAVSDVRRQVGTDTTDGRFVTRAVVEGAAVYLTDAYVARHVPDARPNSMLYPGIRDAYPAGSYQRYANAQYVEGHEYVADRVGGPANVSTVYERPPTTSEQVIHGLSPSSEPARPLSVAVRADGSAFATAGRDTMGEAFVRTMLAGGVGTADAESAAAGWGNDRRVVVRDGERVGYAWALRWDSAEDAEEFRDAALRTLTGLDGVGSVRIEPVGEETVVLLLGDEAFVGNASVSGGTGEIVVTVDT